MTCHAGQEAKQRIVVFGGTDGDRKYNEVRFALPVAIHLSFGLDASACHILHADPDPTDCVNAASCAGLEKHGMDRVK